MIFLGNYTDSTNYSSFYFRDTPDFQISFVERVSDTYNINAHSRRMARDTGWYHIVWAVDTTQATDTDRVKLYVNGVQETLNESYSSGTLNTNAPTLPSQNYETRILGAYNLKVGARSGTDCWDGLMSQFYLIDGAALGPENFGFTDPLTNTWKPKKYNHRTDLYGVTWSTALVGDASGFQDPGLAADGFDGEVGTSNGQYAQNNTGSNPSTITFTPVGGIKFNSSIQVYIINAANTVNVNGEGAQTIAANEWVTVKTGSGTLNTLVFSRPTTGGASFAGIRVDGHILIDAQNDNSFYLPFDGNSPIGQDKSGNGNDWTPVNFGGSVALDNPQVSGARPILNTTQGGTQAGVGVFGSKQNVGYAVTVYDDGGGNKYYIDGVKQATLTGLIRGATYTFDTSDSTIGSTHPFRLSATSAHGTEYTDGVVANTGAATTITIPHDAPNELYYYCTAHSGMGSSITGITTNTSLADPYAWKCILAVPGTGGSYEDVSPSIACTSVKKSASAGGNPSSDSSSNFYGSSIDLDGNDKVTYTRTNAGDFSAQNDFTIEAWFNTDTTGATDAALFSNWDSGNNRSILFGPNASGNGDFTFIFNTTGSGSWTTVANPDAIAGKWMHVAWVYDHSATRHYAYINGILQGSATGTAYNNSTANFLLGVNKGDASGYYNGKVQDLRYYHAVKYTASGTTAGEVVFTLPSSSPDILPDTPSGVSGSSKLTKITDGAVNFQADLDHLNVGDSSDYAFGTGDFTIEAFYYSRGSTAQQTIFGDVFGNSSGIYFRKREPSNGNVLGVYTNADIVLGATAVSDDTWHHVALTREGSNIRLFLDGKLDGSATDSTNLTSTEYFIGDTETTSSGEMNGFISNLRVIKGTALYTSSFTPPTAPLTNVTNTVLLCCQSPTSATTAAVAPGSITANGNAAATNFNPFNTDINTVRGQETGYCTFNVLRERSGGYNPTFSDGNLFMDGRGDGTGTLSASSGKFYYEVLIDTVTQTSQIYLGVQDAAYPGAERGWSTAQIAAIRDQGAFYGNGSTGTAVSYGAGDLMSFAFDTDNNKLYIAKNGVYMNGGNPSQGTGFTHSGISFVGGYTPIVSDGKTGQKFRANFGQKPFKFPPPDGFQPLNTANTRPVKVISRPDHYVGTILYVGAGATKTFTGLNFGDAPDFVWMKNRDRASYGDSTSAHHFLYDSVRGTGTGKMLTSSTNEAEGSKSTEADLDGFVRDGFRLDAASGTDCINNSGDDFVAWCWKAGGSKNTFNVDGVGYASASDSGLTAGTIPPTGASVGTKQGFSIIKYEGNGVSGATLPHGLTQAPDFVVVKNLEETESWGVYHSAQGGTKYAFLNSDNGFSASAALWNNTNTTSSVLTLGNYNGTNKDDIDFIAYLWHDVPGLQKFGSYTGNGDANGPFVELGFRPSILMVKEVNNNSTRWCVWDDTWDNTNPMGENLFWNSNAAKSDSSNHNFDLLSNGFKARTTSDNRNRDDATYVYAAWAAAPSVDLYGGQSNAR